jgi:hypothetical protein
LPGRFDADAFAVRETIMEHKLYVREKIRVGGIKNLIRSLATHLEVRVEFTEVLVVETDDPRLADMAHTLANANGELLHLVSMQDLVQPSGLMTREEAMDACLGSDQVPDGPALAAIEKGEGRLLILTNEDHSETHAQAPAPETTAEETPVKPKRQLTFKPRHCEICDQEYIPTGARQVGHKDCPGKDSGPTVTEINRQLREKKFVDFKQEELEEWQHAETGDRYRESVLRDKVLKGKYPEGTVFKHDRRGDFVVVQRNFRFVLSRVPVKQAEGKTP